MTTQLTPEQRCVELVRRIADDARKSWASPGLVGQTTPYSGEAIALVKLLPDEDLEAAEDIVRDAIMWGADSKDFMVAVRCTARGIRHGREQRG